MPMNKIHAAIITNNCIMLANNNPAESKLFIVGWQWSRGRHLGPMSMDIYQTGMHGTLVPSLAEQEYGQQSLHDGQMLSLVN